MRSISARLQLLFPPYWLLCISVCSHMSLCVAVCTSVCLPLCVPLYPYVSLCVFMYLCAYVCPCVCLCTPLSVLCMILCVPVCLCYVPMCLCVPLYALLSLCARVHVCTYVPVCIFVCTHMHVQLCIHACMCLGVCTLPGAPDTWAVCMQMSMNGAGAQAGRRFSWRPCLIGCQAISIVMSTKYFQAPRPEASERCLLPAANPRPDFQTARPIWRPFF